MSENHDTPGMSRRKVLAGLGAATGAAGLAAAGLPGFASAASVPAGRSLPSAKPMAIPTPTAGLTYLPFDGLAFFSSTEGGRSYDVSYGTRSLVAPTYSYCSMSLPVGSVVHELIVTYRGAPIAFIDHRSETPPYWESLFNTGALTPTATPATLKFELPTPIEITHGYTYILRAYAELFNGLNAADGSILGMTVGYVPVASGFAPYGGTTPRILDTRLGGGKVLPGDSGARVIDLGMAGAKAAVINVTADSTEGYGYFSVFPDGVAYPGNSSLNWTAANVTIANTVIAPLSTSGKIKLRAGESAAHAIVDVQGFLF